MAQDNAAQQLNTRPRNVAEMRQWLRNWVAKTVEVPVAEVGDEQLLEEFGLSSRDVVVLSGDLQRLTGSVLDATVAYEHNTISSLADYLMHVDQIESEGLDGRAAITANSGAALTSGQRDIAIVGMAGTYPGAENAEQMWDMLIGYEDGISEPPANRWTEWSNDPEMTRRMAGAELIGGYLPDLAEFDAEFFGLSPVEAANMDPQQRILLKLTWDAMEDALIPANTLRGANVGVFMGSTNNDYANLITADSSAAHPYALTGNSTSIIANRLSYAFDFRGPSVAMDTACSSSLVAIHQAVRSLRDGDSDVAVAGGVNLLASPFATVAFSELGVLSPTGQIHAFSDDADGIVRSDGAGVLVLKRLADAQRDGNNILGIVKGSAVNSDGRSNGLTAPNPDAQVDVLRAAYADAGIDPTSVDYVEAHGTGTILGDPIEATALGAVLGAGRDASKPTLLGSAKTNFGHTEAAAGVAGVMKVLMAMREGVLPPSLNYSGPNPYIDFDGEKLEVVEDAREWPEYSGRAIAGVSGFGFGGTNAHVVIAAPTAAELAGDVDGAAGRQESIIDWDAIATTGSSNDDAEEGAAPAGALLAVSGLLPSRRRQAAADLRDWLAGNPTADLRDVAAVLAGRNHARSRGMVIANTREDALDGLNRLAEGKRGQNVAVADSPEATGPVWVYSGFGSQHRKMGKELFELSPFFAARLREIDAVIQQESGWSLVEKILDDEQTYDLESAQVGITAIQIALTDLMRELGLRPSAVVGQSLGEIAAGYAVGGLSMPDAMRVACHRSRLMGEGESFLDEADQGAMAVVELGVDALASFQKEHPEFDQVEPAVYAAPGMTTVGGPREPVQKLVEHLEGEGKFARMLDVKGAGHTSMLDPILGELHFEIADIQAQPIHTTLYSTVHRGEVYQPGEKVHTAEYYVHCTRYPVWFSDATGKQFDDGFRTFVEFSANPVALMPLMNNAFAHDAGESKLVYLLKRKENSLETLEAALAELYVRGGELNLQALYGTAGAAATGAETVSAIARRVPGQHWNLQHHWTNARPASGAAPALPGTRIALPDGRIAFGTTADQVASLEELVEAAAEVLAPGTPVSAVRSGATLPASGDVTTIAQPTLGGWALNVHDANDAAMPLVGEAFVASVLSSDATGANSTSSATVPSSDSTGETAPAKKAHATKLPELDEDAARWSPDSGVTVAQRLREIVSESMGYDVEDLPGELPLIDLGLDSLMGMRIKNRVEYEFDLPPLQVQALRDGSVDGVIALVEDLVAERHGGAGAESAQTAVGVTESATESAAAASAESQDAEDQDAEGQATDYTVTAGGVAPRDASERLVFATWAKINGKAAAGVTTELPEISEDIAAHIADRLTERSGAEITSEQVASATNLAEIADVVRSSLETDVEGNIRVLRARPEGSEQPSVFLFHPAGGSSVVYQPLVRRLPEDVPVYGVERLEGPLAERAAAYLPEIIEYAAGQPVILGGWSFGGALAYEVAFQLTKRAAAGEPSVEIERIHLLDTVQPKTPAPDTTEEMHARWDRYAEFAKKTYGIQMKIPHEMLEVQGESAMMSLFQQLLQTPEAQNLGLPAGVLEHQRASFVDNRILESLDFAAWGAVDVPVTLFRAERMHDGAIELEPAYKEIAADGGWGQIVEDLDVVQLNGDHLAIVDEPEISKVGKYMTQQINDAHAGRK